MSEPHAHLQELAALITQSVQVVLEQYSANSRPVPSLDCAAEDVPMLVNQPILDAVRTLEGACAQLCASVMPAVSVMVEQACEMMTPACIHVALSGRIAEHLRDGPKTPAELARLSGIDASKLARVMRRLSLRHCFKEVSKDVFVNNKLSACLLPERTESALIGHLVDEVYHGFGSLSETLNDPEWTSSEDKTKSPFARAHKAPLFEFLEKDPIRGARFTTAMQGVSVFRGGPGIVIDVYPWDALPPDSTFCDVGGGVGQVALAVLSSKPHMRAVVQDEPQTIARAEQFWRERSAGSLDDGRARLVPIDFFTEAPVAGCAVYYLKQVLHDWPDADCVSILRNVRKAMTLSHARVLIHDIVLEHTASEVRPLRVDADALNQAPFPLLSNYGAGALRACNADINMLSTLNARERTLAEFVAIGEEAGLGLVKLFDCESRRDLEFDACRRSWSSSRLRS